MIQFFGKYFILIAMIRKIIYKECYVFDFCVINAFLFFVYLVCVLLLSFVVCLYVVFVLYLAIWPLIRHINEQKLIKFVIIIIIIIIIIPHRSGFKFQIAVLSVLCVMFQIQLSL